MDAVFEDTGHDYDLSSLQAELGLGPDVHGNDLPGILSHRGPQPWKPPSRDAFSLQRDVHELLGIHDNTAGQYRRPHQSGFPQYGSAPQRRYPDMGPRAAEQAWYSNSTDAPEHRQQHVTRNGPGKRRRGELGGKYGKDFEIPQDVKEEPDGLPGEDPEWTPDQEESPRAFPRANRYA